MAANLIRSLRKTSILFDHPNGILGTCVMDWGEYPPFVSELLNKYSGFKVHVEYFSANDKVLSLLYVAQTTRNWQFVNFETQTIGDIRPVWGKYFYSMQQALEAFISEQYEDIIY